jgi:hypothetical protein
MRLIQRHHHVSILDGAVTVEDIYSCCQDTSFDIIHFASHSDGAGVSLSAGAILTAEEIAQICRLRETLCVVFNSCLSGRLAAYCVRHGLRYAVFMTEEMLDPDAWKLMVGFYDFLRTATINDIVSAFCRNDSGEGDYALGVDPDYVRGLQVTVEHVAAEVERPVTRADMVRYGLIIVVLSTLMTVLANFLAGGLH